MTDRPPTLAAALASSPLPLFLLVGESGSGRFGRLAAAVEELHRGGAAICALEIDLDGFESNTDDCLARFLAARVLVAPELAPRAARLAPLATALPRSHRSALLLALLLATEPDSDAPIDLPFEPGRAFAEVLRGLLPPGERLALFVRSEELTGPLARALTALTEDLPGLTLVIAVAPNDEAEIRLLLPAVEPNALPRFPTSPQDTLDGEALAPLAALFDRLELDAARELEAFLDGAALLAPNAPADVAGFLAGRGPEEAEALLDQVDEELADGAAERILWDFEYGHPSFPGQPVYRFVRPALACAIAERWPPAERQRRAREAFERLAPKLPADSRGRTRLLLHLARTAGLDPARRRLLAELALGCDAEESAEAERHVAALLDHDVLAPGEVLAMVEGTEQRWPTERRLALVSGLRGRTARLEEAAGQALLEARFLAEAGRLPEATNIAREALGAAEAAFAEGDPRIAGATHLLGLLLAQQGDLAAAEPLLARTVDVLGRAEGLAPGVVAGARSRWGEVLRRAGRPAEARKQFVVALELVRTGLGAAHPAVAASLNDLALVSRDLGALEEAVSFHRQALEVHRRAFGPDHPNVALDWNNLGSVEQQRSRPEEARRAFEQAVAVLRRHALTEATGPSPSLVVALANLAGTLFNLGERDEACARFTEAAQLAPRLFGPEHPLTVDLQREVLTRCG